MTTRDYSTISPSARAVLAMRSLSPELPFVREAAELVLGKDALAAEHARLQALVGWQMRLWHFVERYQSLDRLLAASGLTNVVELAAGLSLRSLALAQKQAVTYLDTDLPEMIETKRGLVEQLAVSPLVGDVKLRAMNALADGELATAVDELPPGPVAILNEGLLMYLDDAEKRRVAANIHGVLAKRGGVWITADIYLTTPANMPPIGRDDRLNHFLTTHRVEENKFASFAAAEQLFTDAGFAVTKREGASPIRQTWMLELAP
ncbi:MAG TPA: class I SAM-dependent methyltransferase [Kofleriaceae bacterium]|jgi:O-methyltransferase involved in polyketide biosynthesis|nr:class I SAM-dependent methyltransferase [Kofleriaceae bacterium]